MTEVGVVLRYDERRTTGTTPQGSTGGSCRIRRSLGTCCGRGATTSWAFPQPPGDGIPGPSHEDLTRSAAVEAGLAPAAVVDSLAVPRRCAALER